MLLAWLGLEVCKTETLWFDDLVRARVHEHASTTLTAMMRAFTFIGGPVALCVLVSSAVLAFWVANLRQEALLMTITFAGAIALEIGLKHVFHRGRPEPYFNTPLPTSFSFPSGHAMYAMYLYGMLAALVVPRTRSRGGRIAILTACSLMIILIGLSRVYLGVHYPSDVLAGYASALIWVIALRAAMGWAIGRHRPRGRSEISGNHTI